ncbi:MAG: hypothetical protein Kow0099_10410 [Candidatus Abyssubacteria bacterium]
MKQEDTRVHSADIDVCLSCVHYQALGCGGRTVYCVRLDKFLLDEPARGNCPHYQRVQEPD